MERWSKQETDHRGILHSFLDLRELPENRGYDTTGDNNATRGVYELGRIDVGEILLLLFLFFWGGCLIGFDFIETPNL